MPSGLEVTTPDPVPTGAVTLSCHVLSVNVAVTDVAAATVTTQVPVPEQPPPLQPEKSEVASPTALNVTTVPIAYGALQVDPQEIPAGVELTVPLPVPTFNTATPTTCATNAAVTDRAWFIVTMQVPEPEHAPPHEPNIAPAPGLGTSVTLVPSA